MPLPTSFRFAFLLLCILAAVYADADTSCVGVACGNMQLPRRQHVSSASTNKITILVYSTHVGPTPLNVNKLNHKIYCDKHGYEYKHFYFTPEAFAKSYSSQPGSWLAVFAAKELLASSTADYFFRVSFDTVFMQMDIRLESMLDPQQRYSFYGTSTERAALDITKSAWMLKKSDFSKSLIGEWLEYAAWGGCGGLNGEEGGLYLTLGTAYHWQASTAANFDCPSMCKNPRLPTVISCVQNWMQYAGFGVTGAEKRLDNIYIYPYPNSITTYHSPDDGYLLQWLGHHDYKGSAFDPLMTRPFTHLMYTAPNDVALMLKANRKEI